MSKNIIDKIWDAHIIKSEQGVPDVFFIDVQLLHEVTSPQAFDFLREKNISIKFPERHFATIDHSIPTDEKRENYFNEQARQQVEKCRTNCAEFGVKIFDTDSGKQGIVHVIAPELGITQPGLTMVCGDSHTSTHGAFGALAFGIGTSEVEHVLATQTLIQKKSKNLCVRITGKLHTGVTSKDVILQTIGKIGTAGGTGMVIEYAGPVIENLNIEQRMTICNMSIEAGARAGLIAPDEKTFHYLKDKPKSPKGANWDKAIAYCSKLHSDSGAKFDKEVEIRGDDISPMVTWGTSPQDVVSVTGFVPDPEKEKDEDKRASMYRSLDYMGLKPNTKMTDIKVDRIFIGSCTNGRIGDLRDAVKIIKGKKVAQHVNAMVVPGSGLVKQQAEEEGIA